MEEDKIYKELLEAVSKLNKELASLKEEVEYLRVDYGFLERKVDFLMQEWERWFLLV